MSPLVEMPRQKAALPADAAAPQPSIHPGSAATGTVGDDVVVLLLLDLAPGSAWWGFSRLVFGTGALRSIPRLRFAKVLGSGREGGFGLQPSATRQGLFLVFDGEVAADDFLADSATLLGYRRRARELCLLKLRAYSCRGSWGGQTIRLSAEAPTRGPIVALTRASIRPLKAHRFWPLAPAAERSLESASGCTLAAGLGEAPLLRQATISAWDSVAAMDAYARHGAHLEAIRSSAQGSFFSESMFVRFVPLSIHGTYKGRRLG